MKQSALFTSKIIPAKLTQTLKTILAGLQKVVIQKSELLTKVSDLGPVKVRIVMEG